MNHWSLNTIHAVLVIGISASLPTAMAQSAAAEETTSLCVSGLSISANSSPPKALETTGPLDPKYTIPSAEAQYNEDFKMIVFDLKGRDLADPIVLAEINAVFTEHGRVLVTNNQKYHSELPESVLQQLGFGKEEQFKWGGQFSGRTVRTRIDENFHGVDAYPAHLPILAHNEIIYQPVAPRRLLLHYRQVSGRGNGGRTFVHSAKRLVDEIEASGEVGRRLMEKMRRHGELLTSGFIDERHPDRSKNYLRSWQVQFDTNDIDVAVRKACGELSYYDKCWKKKLAEKDSTGNDLFVLMTEVKIPLFNRAEESGEEFFLFPRLGYDGPHLANGFRDYRIGDGTEFSKDELDVLLTANWRTREGAYQHQGDLLIIDNLRFAHSREPFREHDQNGVRIKRVAGIVMGGRFFSNDEKGRKLKAALESGLIEQISPKDGPSTAP